MVIKTANWALPLLALSLSGAVIAHERAADNTTRAQERMDRDNQRVAERADRDTARYAEERAQIEARAAQDPVKAREDLAKLEADYTRERIKSAEELARIEADYREELAKAAEDDQRSEDRSERGSSEAMHDLADSEAAEHDGRGFPVRRGEVVGLDLRAETLAAATRDGFRVVERIALPGLGRELVRLAAPAGMTAELARQALLRIDPAASVDLVHYYGLNLTAGERPRPIRGKVSQGGVRAAGAIGMIDTAVGDHPALAKTRITSWQPGNLATAPREHGTAVASILAAQGGNAVFVANIFRGPAGRPFTSADVIAQAVAWSIEQGAPVINMSLAGPRNAILDQLIRDALGKGRLVVAAAGNGGPTAAPAYPAAVPGVIAVTAVDAKLHVYRYAQHGRHISVAGRGVDVVAAYAPGGTAKFTGTSFATPLVAGWLARCRNGGGTAAQCVARLRQSARDLGAAGFDEIYGFGLIE